MHTTSPVPGTLVGIATLVEMLQRSRASIYRDIARGAFPKAVKLGHSSRWLVSEVDAYIQTLSERRESHGARVDSAEDERPAEE